MKMKKIYRAILALALAFALAVPALASGEPTGILPEEQAPVQTPETPEEAPAEDVPGWLLPTEDGEQTPDTPADPAAPETPAESETPEMPETPENPEVSEDTPPSAEPETPENPETPDTPEVPENPGQPIDPDTPEIPETPTLPDNPTVPENPDLPPWLLPPEEAPAPDIPAPGPEDPAPLPENPIAEEAPVIEVLVPSSGRIIINPYALPVELEGQTATDQIVSTPLILENRSTMPVSVSASVTGTVPPGSGVTFAAVPPMPDSPMKEIFLYAEFHAVPEPALQPAWSGMFSDSTNQLLVGFQSTVKTDVLRLEASGAAYSFGAMRLFGSAAVSPMAPWQAGDDIQATFMFSFTPIVEAPTADVPVTDEPVMDMPAADEPAADVTVPGEFAGPLPDADPGAGELSVPGWLFPN